MAKVRIKLASIDINTLNEICYMIKDIASKAGVMIAGPIPLPTKHLNIATRKSPCGEGTHSWEHYEMRIHKRLINIDANERCMRRIMRIKVPDNVHIEITLI